MKLEIPNRLVELIDKAHEEKKERPRAHLGASTLGHPCERWLWLSFRWAVIEHFSGRILRLFRRGQNEEDTVIADLRLAGLEIDGQQDRVDFGFHVSGSMDGIVLSGVPEAPNKKHVLEIKTHSKKSFDDLVKNGVAKSKPMHYGQMQAYMRGTGIDRALYVAICKDDDSYYIERVRYDESTAIVLVQRGKRIALTERLPPPISTDETWYQCRFCAAHDFCHGSKLTIQVNCRTCAHVTPKDDGTFYCTRWSDTIPVDAQHEGCRSHVLHPDLVPFKLAGGDEWNAQYEINGSAVVNGESGEASEDIIKWLN
jgi:hypothetical protein